MEGAANAAAAMNLMYGNSNNITMNHMSLNMAPNVTTPNTNSIVTPNINSMNSMATTMQMQLDGANSSNDNNNNNNNNNTNGKT